MDSARRVPVRLPSAAVVRAAVTAVTELPPIVWVELRERARRYAAAG